MARGLEGHDSADLLSRQRLLGELGELALSDVPAIDVVEAVTDALAQALDAEMTALFEPLGRDGALALRAGPGWAPHVQPATLPAGVVDAARGVHRLDALPALAEARFLRSHDVRTGVVAVLRTAGQAYGLLGAFSRRPVHFGGTDTEFLRALGNLLAGALERRAVEDSLRASERRLLEAQKLAHVGSYDWNILTDENVWSDELYRIYGTEPQSFNASYEQFLAFVHPDDRESVIEVHRKAYETCEPYQTEERIVRSDGSERVLATTGEVITDDSGQPVRMRGICIDVTEQRRTEEMRRRLAEADELRSQALEINDNIVQGLTAAVWAFERRELEAATAAVRNTLGAARQMIHGLLARSGASVSAGDLIRERPAPSVFGGAVTGSPVPASPARGSRPVRVVVADDAEDIRLMLELVLAGYGCEVVAEAASGRQVGPLVVEHEPDLLVLDLAMPGMDGIELIPLVRQACPETRIVVLSGFSADEMRETALAAGADAYVEKGADQKELIEAIALLAPGTGPEPESPFPPDPDDDSLDATKARHLIHELRTPLSVVVGLASTLHRQIDVLPSPVVAELLESIERNALLLNDLVTAVSEAGTQGSGTMSVRTEPTDLVGLVRATVDDLWRLETHREVRVAAPGELVAPVDGLRLRQVLVNLLDNARKHSEPGAPVTVSLAADDAAIVLAVSDRGPGIPPERRAELFERLPSLGGAGDGNGDGAGIGLAISRQIAEALGGTLELDAAYHDGARFVLRLPTDHTVEV